MVAIAQDLITFDVTGHIATVAFNRPDQRNAVTTPMFGRLVEIFDEINESKDIFVVLLKGNGPVFCAGADQKERKDMSLADVRRRRRISPQAFGAMRTCIHPVIAVVQGAALGGGLEMALACDIVVAAEGTVMGLIETTRGVIPAGGGTQLLPRLVGPSRAKEIIFTGRRFKAEEALTWGMLNHVVPADQLDSFAQQLAEEICGAAPVAVTQAKKAINASLDLDIPNGVLLEAALYERCLTTQDRNEGLHAYHEKRRPEFKGE